MRFEEDSDVQKFREFFDTMGVTHDDCLDSDEPVMFVAQANFYFDKKGRYLRVVSDDTGHVYEREN